MNETRTNGCDGRLDMPRCTAKEGALGGRLPWNEGAGV